MSGATPSADAAAILHAILALAGWSVVMLAWMYATRLPAMTRAGLAPQDAARVADLQGRLPRRVEQVADNYNHLMEAPTVFYAVALAVVALGAADGVHAACAWAFVGLRVAHSIVQATLNPVVPRFVLFLASWFAVVVMLVRVALAGGAP